jgi:hypothetical protein
MSVVKVLVAAKAKAKAKTKAEAVRAVAEIVVVASYLQKKSKYQFLT